MRTGVTKSTSVIITWSAVLILCTGMILPLTGTANAARVDLINPMGTVITSSPVNSGTATISIGQYHYPIAANIKAYNSANNVIASTANTVNMFGGHVYSVR